MSENDTNKAMGCFSVELSEKIAEIVCECCGQPKKRVWGFVSRHNEAYAVYFGLLNITEEEPRVGLTLSIGPWWDDTAQDQRSWIHVEVRSEKENYAMEVLEATKSNHYPWSSGGKPMNREEALASPSLAYFWEVADYIVETDPALRSYLQGRGIDTNGRPTNGSTT